MNRASETNSEASEPIQSAASQTNPAVLEGFFRLSANLLGIIGFDGFFQRVNPALERALGYEQQNLRARPWLEFLHPDDRAVVNERIQRLQKGETTLSLEARCLHPDGSYKWLFWNLAADREQNLIYASAHPITRRREAEEAKKRADKFLTSIVENIPHMIFVKDAENLRFVRINKAEEEMIGLSQEQMLGKNDYELFPGEEANFFIGMDRSVLESGKLLDIPEETVHCAKGARIFHTKKIPIFDDDGKPQYLLGISEDITEYKQAEEELRARNARMQADLELARAMQEAFILEEYPCFPTHTAPENSALAFYHRYIPDAALGGDFFHVTALSDSRAAIFICDVMGHGVRSALVTAMIRALVGEQNAVAHDPGAFLTELNRHLRGILEQAHTPMFASAFYLVIDTALGQISYANAGHPSPLRLRQSDNSVKRLVPHDKPSGMALGILDDEEYQTTKGELAADDLFVLYTDGLFEVQGHDDEYGEARLIEALQKHIHLPADSLFDQLLNELRAFSANGEFDDDVCLVGAKVAHLGKANPS
jgi:sigma-B regulation protein RsbU (phosphoserine phosphatase)